MKHDIHKLVDSLSAELIKENLFVSVAESCTGGWLAKTLTDRAGSSAWFAGGVVSYSNASKVNVLRVDKQLLARNGAVSEAVAEAMALGAQRAFYADLTVAITGVAGPDGGTVEKPVGLVWFGLSQGNQLAHSVRKQFQGTRDEIRKKAVATALELLLAELSA